MNKKHIVLSAVNLTEGGPLTILRDCLAEAKKSLLPTWKITVLVHNRSLIDCSDVEVIEFPDIKKRWHRRMIFEWISLRKISKVLNADVWFSLQDISPVVTAKRRAVYCHNPGPYYKPKFSDIWYSRPLFLQSCFYSFLYSINIKTNSFVVVQQEWLRNSFKEKYEINNVVVAYPSAETFNPVKAIVAPKNISALDPALVRFFYPALPRTFKNIEILLSAAEKLWKTGARNFELVLTFSPNEDPYARKISKNYKDLPYINFIGRLIKEDVQYCYAQSSALLFPSKLETWGLPITEAKAFNLPIICADLPYARETVGAYDKAAFCSPSSADEWAKKMHEIIEGKMPPSQISYSEPSQPFASNWTQLLAILTSNM